MRRNEPYPETVGSPAHAGRERMTELPHEPMLYGDWLRALMIHYEVDRDSLQAAIPFELDLHEGRAFVSLVAFCMNEMRPRLGGKLSALLFKPIDSHGFLNVRTYVRCHGEPGVMFITEWLSNRLSVALGPLAFGLPYRWGKLNYDNWNNEQILIGAEWKVENRQGKGQLIWRTPRMARESFRPCDPASLDEWLMERYTAFTYCRGMRRFFRVWHSPWPQVAVEAKIEDESLLRLNLPFIRGARLVGANYSPGVRNVWMGWPHSIKRLGQSHRPAME